MKRIRLRVSLIALCFLLVFALSGCGKGSESEKAKEYAVVTVQNGTIDELGLTSAEVRIGASITVTADEAAGFEQAFSHWEIDGVKVSDSETYTFEVTDDVVITCVYGSSYSMWSGEYPEAGPKDYVVDEENKVMHIGSADALAYWADTVRSTMEGGDRTDGKYSTFSINDYGRLMINHVESDREFVKKVIAEVYNPDNAWTVSIDTDIDMGGISWIPINDLNYSLNDMVIEGNGHTIRNFYTEPYEFGTQIGSPAGFFGHVASTSMTVRNLRFLDARVDAGAGSGVVGYGILFGYAHGNASKRQTERAQTINIENVTVENSFVGGTRAQSAGMLIGRLGPGWYNHWPSYDGEDSVINIKECTFKGNVVAGGSNLGQMIGYMVSGDADYTTRSQLTLNISGLTYENNIGVTTGTTDVGSVGLWRVWKYNMSAGAVMETKNSVLDWEGVPSATVKLNVTASKLATDATKLREALASEDDVFVAGSFDYSAYAQDKPADGKYVYFVAGAEAEGADFGSSARYIDGSADASGRLCVKNAAGETVGYWDTQNGAFVAA